MRYTLAQLRKMKFPHSENNIYDLSSELDGLEDIISSGECKTKEVITYIGADSYQVSIDIEIDLVLGCSITLEELPYNLRTKATEFYTFDKETSENGDFIYLDGQTLDTKDEIISEILIEKPMVSKKDGAEFIDEVSDDSDDGVNPVFAGLKDLLNK